MERHVKPHRKRPEYAQAILNRTVLADWKGRDARTIKPTEVIQLLDRLVDKGSPVAANRTAALLSQLFRFGVASANRGIQPGTVAVPPRRQGKAAGARFV